MRECPACGAANEATDDFCGNCGGYLGWSDDPGTRAARAGGPTPAVPDEPLGPPDAPGPGTHQDPDAPTHAPARDPDTRTHAPARDPESRTYDPDGELDARAHRPDQDPDARTHRTAGGSGRPADGTGPDTPAPRAAGGTRTAGDTGPDTPAPHGTTDTGPTGGTSPDTRPPGTAGTTSPAGDTGPGTAPGAGARTRRATGGTEGPAHSPGQSAARPSGEPASAGSGGSGRGRAVRTPHADSGVPPTARVVPPDETRRASPAPASPPPSPGAPPSAAPPSSRTGAEPSPPPTRPVSPPPIRPASPTRTVPPARPVPPTRPDAPRPVKPAKAAAPRPVVRPVTADEDSAGVPCPVCGTPNQPHRRFCRRCAAPLVAVAAPAPLPWWRTVWPFRRRTRAGSGRLTRLLVILAVVLALCAAGFLLLPAGRNLFEDTRDKLAKAKAVTPARVTATDQVPGHPPDLTTDGLSNRYWAVSGPGASVTYTFGKPFRLVDLIVTNGASKSAEEYARQARALRLDMEVTGQDGKVHRQEIDLSDKPGAQTVPVGISDVRRVRLTLGAPVGLTHGRRIALAEVEFFQRA